MNRNVADGVAVIRNAKRNVRKCVTGSLTMNHARKRLNVATIVLVAVESRALHFVVNVIRTQFSTYSLAKRTKKTPGLK